MEYRAKIIGTRINPYSMQVPEKTPRQLIYEGTAKFEKENLEYRRKKEKINPIPLPMT